jgi:hypothetical protein
MFYLIYKITNNISGKVYIGSHKTQNQADNYMGSGRYLNYAYKKYGLENFTKEILFVYDNPADMYTKEAELVNEDFLATENTYNLKVGGFGGFNFINNSGKQHIRDFTDADRLKATDARSSISIDKWSKIHKERYTNFSYEQRLNWNSPGRKIAMGPEAIAKRKEVFKSINHQQGQNNSQFGTCWVHNGMQNKKIKKEELASYIAQGFTKGRKLKA